MSDFDPLLPLAKRALPTHFSHSLMAFYSAEGRSGW
jgi:hypothetical protein